MAQTHFCGRVESRWRCSTDHRMMICFYRVYWWINLVESIGFVLLLASEWPFLFSSVNNKHKYLECSVDPHHLHLNDRSWLLNWEDTSLRITCVMAASQCIILVASFVLNRVSRTQWVQIEYKKWSRHDELVSKPLLIYTSSCYGAALFYRVVFLATYQIKCIYLVS